MPEEWRGIMGNKRRRDDADFRDIAQAVEKMKTE